jgi:hypothetical protein
LGRHEGGGAAKSRTRHAQDIEAASHDCQRIFADHRPRKRTIQQTLSMP